MWWVSRGSPDSITRPQRRRVPSRTRWWWTAATASSDGIATRSAPTSRSDRISTLIPSATMSCASWQMRSTARSIPSGPSATGQVMSIVCERKTSCETWRSRSSSWSRRIGWRITSWCACSGVSSSRLPEGPTPLARLMTIDSRMGSIAGFVTWANSCLK